VKTPERAAELLARGTLERRTWRQLAQPDFAGNVNELLGAVNLELASGGERWIARPLMLAPPPGRLRPRRAPLASLAWKRLVCEVVHLRALGESSDDEHVPRRGGGVALGIFVA